MTRRPPPSASKKEKKTATRHRAAKRTSDKPAAVSSKSEDVSFKKLMKEETSCWVCGYDALSEPPRNRTGGASMEICPCCGFQFGVTDDDEGISYDEYRQTWITSGMQWKSKGRKAPEGWSPQTQLASLALRATRARVKGRPPRTRPEQA